MMRFLFAEMCDLLIYFHEEGIAKPERRIFALTCERLGVQPAEIVFLDDVEANVIPTMIQKGDQSLVASFNPRFRPPIIPTLKGLAQDTPVVWFQSSLQRVGFNCI